MFMFQTGLFATFIPELIMVMAYLLCLFIPANKNVESVVSEQIIYSNHSKFENQHINTYTVSSSDYNFYEAETTAVQVHKLFYYQISKIIFSKPVNFNSSEVLFQLFSRPPPFSVL